MADRRLQLPQPVVNGHGYGRNINHDPRSLSYQVAEESTAKSVEHEIVIPILNQAQIGKCVAETGAEFLGWSEIQALLPPELIKVLSTVTTAEQWTSALYHELTLSDGFPGTWKPDDTGSDGLTLGKVLVKMGLISGYRHVTTIGQAETAIQASPFALGTAFLADMENPSPEGIVQVSGQVMGGHEYLCYKRDAARDLWWFRNHWTADWGLHGVFAYDSAGLEKLMAMQGDITVPIPLNQPAPTPTPPPAPAPGPGVNQPDWAKLAPFMDHPRSYSKAEVAATELSRWKQTVSA